MEKSDVSIRFAEVVDSTNRWAIREAEAGCAKDVLFVASRQTAGRGSGERTWQSDGGGLYMSMLIHPQTSVQELGRLPMLAAVAMNGALRGIGVDAKIKWPNDIVARGKKLCGILCESRIAGSDVAWCVIGVGVNISQVSKDFQEGFRHQSTSLIIELEREVSGDEIIRQFLFHMRRWRDAALLGSDAFFSEYRLSCVTLDCDVRVITRDAIEEGHALDIQPDGGLLVKFGGQIRTVYAGDVSVRGREDYA